MLLIGSRALKSHLQYLYEEDIDHKDWNFICFRREVKKEWPNYFGADDLTVTQENSSKIIADSKSKGKCTFELIKEDSSAEKYIENLKEQSFFDKRAGMFIVPAPLYVLYSIKKAHITLPIEFHRHIKSYILLKEFCKVDKVPDITKFRKEELEKSFVNNTIGDIPKYRVVKDEFNDLDTEEKIRFVFDLTNRTDISGNFENKLNTVCTLIYGLPEWFRVFAIDNYYNVLKLNNVS